MAVPAAPRARTGIREKAGNLRPAARAAMLVTVVRRVRNSDQAGPVGAIIAPLVPRQDSKVARRLGGEVIVGRPRGARGEMKVNASGPHVRSNRAKASPRTERRREPTATLEAWQRVEISAH
jgi:hypothetical protein